MTNAIITKTYNTSHIDTAVLIFREDGYFNMTFAAQAFGKRLDHFMASPETKEYLAVLSSTPKYGDLELVEKVKGNRYVTDRGTWAHPKLAVFFARWLDTKFSVWCDAVIDDILHGNQELKMVNKEESAVAALPADVQAAGEVWKAEMQAEMSALRSDLTEAKALLSGFLLKREGEVKNAEYMTIGEYLELVGLHLVDTNVKRKMRDAALLFCQRRGMPTGTVPNTFNGKTSQIPSYPKAALNEAFDEVYAVAAFDWIFKLTA